ncbi:MAG: hypothetical protein LBC88_01730 [Spirochaetaceae bacterium]|jgi:hypothetical protein|nr:hypothetical protein [Spirochaetaceae bacterium]
MRGPEKILYLAGTHWDREWYLPFESFRFRLVSMMDETLEVLEQNPAFSRFILDGQTILLDDYLAIRPENRERITALLRAERLKAGPWYTMPDEFLSSGESLIQNLCLGFDTARQFGVEPMRYGYVCDVFGHIAQLPQILNGFGITGALLGRGTNAADCPAHFIWQSPDGSRCITFKVPEECGYGTFFFEVVAPYRTEENAGWDALVARAKHYVERELTRSALPCVVLMDAMDHESIHPEAVRIAEELSGYFGCPVEFGAPDQLLAELEKKTGLMPVLTGELRQTGRAMVEHNKLLPHTLSSRYDVKEAHDACQNLLERRALPLAALAQIQGKPLPEAYFSRAQKLLAECEAHDSICGCSIDQVSEDVLHRLRQADIIGGEIRDFSAAAAANLSARGKNDDLTLVLFNTEMEAYSAVVRVPVHFPPAYPGRRDSYLAYEPYNMFTLTGADGREIPVQILDIEPERFTGQPRGFYREKRDRYLLAFAASLPPGGRGEFRIQPRAQPGRNTGSLLTGPLCMENTHIKAEITSSGLLAVTDKAAGRRYDGLLAFRDYGETGDGWYHAPPAGNPVIWEGSGEKTFEVYRDGSEICTLRLSMRMRVPARLERGPAGIRRSAEEETITVTSFITLAKTSRWVEIETVIHNTARDHKMTVNFPTGQATASYEADQPFAFVRRGAGSPPATGTWKEYDRGNHAFTGVVMRRGADGTGLAFLSGGGMHECAAHTDPAGTLEITLFRAFGATFLTNGENGGQLLGEMRFRFALLPLSGADTPGSILKMRNHYLNPPLAYTVRGFDPAGPRVFAGFSLESKNIVLSVLRPARTAGFTCVRLVNYGEAEEEALITAPAPIVEAYRTDLPEEKREAAPFAGTEIHCRLPPCRIATFLLRLETEQALPGAGNKNPAAGGTGEL